MGRGYERTSCLPDEEITDNCVLSDKTSVVHGIEPPIEITGVSGEVLPDWPQRLARLLSSSGGCVEQDGDQLRMDDYHAEVIEIDPSVDDQALGDVRDDQEAPAVSWKSVMTTSNASRDNRLMVPITMSGSQVMDAMVDTGAGRSMISKRVLESQDITFTQLDNVEIGGFGASTKTKVLGVATIIVSLCGKPMAPTEFYVLDLEGMASCSIILATDFLEANMLCVDMRRQRLSGKLEDGSFWEYYVRQEDQPSILCCRDIPCFGTTDTTLKSQQTRKITISWSAVAFIGSDGHDGEDWSRYFVDEVTDHRDYQVFSGFIDVSAATGIVLLTNSSSQPIMIRKGELVCTISSVIDAAWLGTSGEESLAAFPAVAESNEGEISVIELSLGTHLTDDQRTRVQCLVEEHKNVFSEGADSLGCLGVTQHRIELHDSTPIYQRPRRFPEKVNEEIERQCRELQLLDVIEPSSSPWSSPVVPVRKKDGSIRLCIDYRKLNAVTKPDKFPLPNLNDAVFGLHGMKYFTSLDMVRGYYQLPLAEDSREYTAFSTPRAHWQFKRLSFGLKNAPSAFQREMQTILSQFPWRRVIVYIDDILIMGEDFEEHLKLVRKVIDTLQAYGCKLRGSKCQWCHEEVEFLGHMVSSAGLRKPERYLEVVRKFEKPKTVRELREFLGFINFQRKFVANCSGLMKPMSSLTGGRGAKKLVWTSEMDEAFVALKEEMLKDITLTFPDYSEGAQPLRLFTDASGYGVGACLMQDQLGKLTPIAFASMTFNSAQQNYNTLERELAAIRWGVKQFRAFLFGVHFIVHTDHQPLVYLHNMQIVNARLARTLADLSDFTFIICYTPGGQNTGADMLSRLNREDALAQMGSSSVSFDLPIGIRAYERVLGGGDSLPVSLLTVAEGANLGRVPPNTTKQLRELLVTELLKKPEKYHLKLTKSLKQEVNLMQYDGQLMCHEAMLAFGHLFGCVVLVHYGGRSPIVYMPYSCSDLRGQSRVHLQCLAGVHFNPLHETEKYTLPELLRSEMQTRSALQPTVGGAEASATDTVDEGEEELCEHIEHLDGPAADVLMDLCPKVWCKHHVPTHIASISVEIQGATYCVLLDTGAQVSCVSKNTVESLSSQLDISPIHHIRGLGDGRSPVLGSTVIRVSMVPGKEVEQKFAVVENSVMPFCFIFGADCLASHGIQLDFSEFVCRDGDGTWKIDLQLASRLQSGIVGILDGISTPIPSNTNRIVLGDGGSSLAFGFGHDRDSSVPNLTCLIDPEEMIKLQRGDRTVSALRRHIQQSSERVWPPALSRYRRYRSFLSVRNGLVVMAKPGGPSVGVITFTLLVEMALVLHHHVAHPGRQKLIAMISEHVWHPSMSKVAEDVTRTCPSCQRMKVSSIKQPPTIKIHTSRPYELVTIDLLALPPTRRRYVCCLVVVDHHTKWASVVPLTSKRAGSVCAAVKYQVLPFLLDTPTTILSDNGPEFRSREFNELLQENGIKHTYTTPLRPSSNGLVERTNRTITELLRNLSSSPSTWDEDLPRAVRTYNTTYHSEIGMSPSQFLLRKEHLTSDAPLVLPAVQQYWREGNPSFIPFRVGQKVLRKVVFKGRLLVDKLEERFEGPFIIKKLNENRITYIMTREGSQRELKSHHGQLRPFHEPPSYLRQHPYYRQLIRSPDSDDCHQSDSVVVEDVRVSAGEPTGFAVGVLWSDSSSDGSCSSGVTEDNTARQRKCSVGPRNTVEISDLIPALLLDCSGASSDFFGCLGRAEQSLLAVNIRPICVASSSFAGSSFLGFEKPVWDHSPIHFKSAKMMSDLDLWPFSDNEVELLDNRPTHPLHILGDSDIRKSMGAVDVAIEHLEDVISGLPTFSGFSRLSSEESDRCQEYSSSRPNDVPLLIEDSARGGVDVEIFPRDGHSEGPDVGLRLFSKPAEVDDPNKSASHVVQQCTEGDYKRSPIGTRSRGNVPLYTNVQPRVLEYHLTSVSLDTD